MRLALAFGLLGIAATARAATPLIASSYATEPIFAGHKYFTHHANGYYWVVFHTGLSRVSLFSSFDGVKWNLQGPIFAINPNTNNEWAVRYWGDTIIAATYNSADSSRTYRSGTLNGDGTVTWSAESAAGPADANFPSMNLLVNNGRPIMWRDDATAGGAGAIWRGSAIASPTWTKTIADAPAMTGASSGTFSSGAVFPTGGANPDDLIVLRATVTGAGNGSNNRLLAIKWNATTGNYDGSWYDVSTLGTGNDTNATRVQPGTDDTIQKRFAAVQDSSGNIHAVYVTRQGDVRHHKKAVGFNDSWSLVSGAVTGSTSIDMVALTALPNNNLYLFYSKSDAAIYYRRFDGAAWGATEYLLQQLTSLQGALAPPESAASAAVGLAYIDSSGLLGVYFTFGIGSSSDLRTTQTGGNFTVTDPGRFEMTFDTSYGGGIQTFYDLAEDVNKDKDLGGGLATANGVSTKTLFHFGFLSNGTTWYVPGDDTANPSDPYGRWNGSPPKLDALEVTSTRVRVRQEAFYSLLCQTQGTGCSAGTLAGLKGYGDYSVYPVGRVALRWTQKVTAAANFTDRDLATAVFSECGPWPATGNCADLTAYNSTGAIAANNPTSPFLLAKREIAGGAKTDFLTILSQNWALADRTEFNNTVAFMNWRDAPGALTAAATESWNFLTYFKPTNLGITASPWLDTAVTYRSTDYRTPAAVTAGLTINKGSRWSAASENTSAANDAFNEAEAAYVLDLDTTQGLDFDITGAATGPRYSPFFKIRQWHSLQPPATVTLEAATKIRNVDFKADVKPVARAHFAQDVRWYSTLNGSAQVTSPNVGDGTGSFVSASASFPQGKSGNGISCVAPEYASFSSANNNFDLAEGALELWYQPTYPHTDNNRHVLWQNYGSATQFFTLEKTDLAGGNQLKFSITNGGTVTAVAISSANYSWRAADWVHLRVSWNSGAILNEQLHLYFAGVEPVNHTHTGGLYTSGTMAVGTNYICRDQAASVSANGIVDELAVYGGTGSSSTPAQLANGGLVGSSSEFLADAGPGKNFILSLGGVTTANQGSYLYLGSDSQMRGLNVTLASSGTGVAAGALAWEFWNGTAWADLEAGCSPGPCTYGFSDGTNSFTKNGVVSWTSDPTGWTPYSVNGGPELYYVRVHLPNSINYGSPPVEAAIKTDMLLFGYCGDITLASQTFVLAAPPSSATSVKLATFGAVGLDSAVSVEWETGTELDNLGFHLYRGESGSGPWERLTLSLIPGLGSSMEGKGYSYLDSGLSNGTAYFYRLDDVDRSGEVTSHGPVSATPQAGAPAPLPEPPPSPGPEPPGPEPPPGDGESGSSWTSHGNPADTSLRVVERTERSVTFELRTGGFYSSTQADGSSRLFIPGFFDFAEPGFPSLPTRRTWTDALVGFGARVASVTAEDLVSFDGLVPSRAGAPQAFTSADATYRASFRRVRPATITRGLYPHAQARVLQTAFRGDEKQAYLEIAPLRLDVSRSRLVLARRMLVTVVFDGVVPGETGTGSTGSSSPLISRSAPRLIARFATRDKGLYAVRWEDLLASMSAQGESLRSFNTSLLRLSRRGAVVPFHVEPRRDVFGPGSTLFFLSEGSEAAYAKEAVYELARAQGGEQMGLRTLPASSAAPLGSLLASRSFETNADYVPGLLEARDRWVWRGLSGGSSDDVPFTLASPVPGSARLRVDLQGASDTEAPADHHVRVSIGTTEVAQAEWDGMMPYTVEADIPAGVLVEGMNTLHLDSDGASTSSVYLDRFSIDYPHAPNAEGGVLQGKALADGPVEASGFSAGSVLLHFSTRPTWLRVPTTAQGLVFPAEAGHDYLAVDPAAILRPEIRPALLDGFPLRDTTRQADWIVVAPRELLPAAEALRLHREAQGLVSIAVSLEEIYDSFGSGEASPDAVRDFLSYAYHRWSPPAPRYVLLLGDASYDPKGFFPSASRKDLLPSPAIKSSFLWTVSDPLYAAVNGDDILPDFATGRLTAGSVEEAEAAVQKILDFENAHLSLDSNAVLVADDPDPLAGDFEADASEIASLLAPRPLEKVFLAAFATAAEAHAAVMSAFDSGSSLFSYIGHGSQGLWASEGLLRVPDVDLLVPQARQPLVLTMTCSNGYFVSPWANSLAEKLTLVPNKGAIAAFSPSGLSLDAPAQVYQSALVRELEAGSHQRLGDLVLAAQGTYLESGAFPELLSIYHLFADPALVVR